MESSEDISRPVSVTLHDNMKLTINTLPGGQIPAHICPQLHSVRVLRLKFCTWGVYSELPDRQKCPAAHSPCIFPPLCDRRRFVVNDWDPLYALALKWMLTCNIVPVGREDNLPFLSSRSFQEVWRFHLGKVTDIVSLMDRVFLKVNTVNYISLKQ